MNGENTMFRLVRCASEEEWLAERMKGIGGSDVGAVLGLNPYKSAYEVWLEKRGAAQPRDLSDNSAVHWGQLLEPLVGAEYKRLHQSRTIRRVNAITVNISRPWARASLDYEVHDPDLGWGILEIKTAGLRSESLWDDGVPESYLAQVVHYMSVTGRGFADIAVLIGGQDYREYRFIRDESDIQVVENAVDDFWNRCVMGGEEPAMTGLGRESQALMEQYPSGEGMLRGHDEEVMRWLEIKDKKKRAESEYAKVSDALKLVIGDFGGIETGNGKLKWVRGNGKDGGLRWFAR